MKPLHILNTGTGDVRPRRASLEEISDILDGNGRWNESLARVSVDADGEIVAAALTEAELKLLTVEMQTAQAEQLIKALDLHLAANRACDDIPGISPPDPICLRADRAGWAEPIVRKWAADRALVATDNSPPADGKSKRWHPSMQVRQPGSSYHDIVRIYWPEVELGEKAVAIEAALHGMHKAVAS